MYIYLGTIGILSELCKTMQLFTRELCAGTLWPRRMLAALRCAWTKEAGEGLLWLRVSSHTQKHSRRKSCEGHERRQNYILLSS